MESLHSVSSCLWSRSPVCAAPIAQDSFVAICLSLSPPSPRHGITDDSPRGKSSHFMRPLAQLAPQDEIEEDGQQTLDKFFADNGFKDAYTGGAGCPVLRPR